MKKFASVSSLMLSLMLFLSACSLTSDSINTEALPAPDNSHRAAFAASGKLYDQRAADIAIREGRIGSTTNLATAAVALFFDSNGNLLTKTETQLLEGFGGATTDTEFQVFLQNAGVTLYYTDAATYRLTMRRLASQLKLSLSDYAPLSASPTIVTAGTQEVAMLSPYGQSTSTASQLGTVSQSGVPILDQTPRQRCLDSCTRACGRFRFIPAILACYGVCFLVC